MNGDYLLMIAIFIIKISAVRAKDYRILKVLLIDYWLR